VKNPIFSFGLGSFVLVNFFIIHRSCTWFINIRTKGVIVPVAWHLDMISLYSLFWVYIDWHLDMIFIFFPVSFGF
jgi:hypothetical protein